MIPFSWPPIREATLANIWGTAVISPAVCQGQREEVNTQGQIFSISKISDILGKAQEFTEGAIF